MTTLRPDATTTGTLLEVEDLSVTFRTEDGDVHAVDRVSFTLEPGEVLGIVGESGCGKSVTALSLVGLLPRSARISGAVRLDGDDLRQWTPRQLRAVRGRQIAMVFQEPMTSLNPVLTVGRQIAEVLRRHEGHPRGQALARAEELLNLVGIPDAHRRLGEYPHQLSGGLRQRVMIAIAVACSPRVLIADEPTTALDVTIQAGILDVLRDLRARLGMAVILITHDLGVVADIADRVMVMYAGRKVEEAPADDLFDRPQHPYTVGLLGAVPNPARDAHGDSTGRRSAPHADGAGSLPAPLPRLREIPGRVPSLTAPPPYCAFADRCPRADDRCRAEQPPLVSRGARHLAACFHPGPDHQGDTGDAAGSGR